MSSFFNLFRKSEKPEPRRNANADQYLDESKVANPDIPVGYSDNYAQNFGASTRLNYDNSAYDDRLTESTGPLLYRVNTNQIYNENSCLSTLGPRGRFGASTPSRDAPALAQRPEVVNIESILTNRNVYRSKNRRNEINPIDVTKIKTVNYNMCNRTLNPNSSRLSMPVANYRELSINRFYDLNKNPQEPLYWSETRDTKLEAKDNFMEAIPRSWSSEPVNPKPVQGQQASQNIRACPTAQQSSCSYGCN
jgi:hypothetical protein